MNHKVMKILKNPAALFLTLGYRGVFNWVPDELYLKIAFWCKTHRKLNLKCPKTFPEKLNWLKLYDRNPNYSDMVDKYKAKAIISERVGEQYTIPTLGVWDSFDEIDFSRLPNEFVLKCNHDSGSIYFCRDKKELDIKRARKILEKGLRHNSFGAAREWPYKNIKPCIIAEKYLEERSDSERCLTDYKFFCFNGIPRIVYVSKDKAERPTTDFFDMEYNHLPIKIRDGQADIPPKKPEGFDEMRTIAEKLSQGIPHLRVDFYQVDGRVYVGEMTFYHLGGMANVQPESWNIKLGEWINLHGYIDK